MFKDGIEKKSIEKRKKKQLKPKLICQTHDLGHEIGITL